MSIPTITFEELKDIVSKIEDLEKIADQLSIR